MTKAEQWLVIERKRQIFYRQFTRLWYTKLMEQAQPFITALDNPNMVDAVQFLTTNKDILKDTFIKTWVIPGTSFAKFSFKENKKEQSFRFRTKLDTPDDFWNYEMESYVLNNAGFRITSIDITNNKAILNVIRQSLEQSRAEGVGISEMAVRLKDDLKKNMNIASRYQAERIARTEIVGASNRGQVLGAQSLGYNMNKEWIATIDSETRKEPFNHAIHEVVRMDQDFVKTGEPLSYPGDMKGSAGNIINCRCTVGFKVL